MWLLCAMFACTGELHDSAVTRTELFVPAGPESARELGISGWAIELDSFGRVHARAVDAAGQSLGRLSYEMAETGRRRDPLLVADSDVGGHTRFAMGTGGVEDDSLLASVDRTRFVAALSRDVATDRPDLEAGGEAPACAELVRTSARACADTLLACSGDGATCSVAARDCAALSLRADRCQRRSL